MSSASALFASLGKKPNTPEGVSIMFDGQELRHWRRVTLKRDIAAAATFEFEAPFDSSSAAHRKAFRPFSFQPCSVLVDGEVFVSGTVLDILPSVSPETSDITVNGYARCGVLGDCTLPQKSWKKTFDGMTVEAICKHVAGAYGLKVEYSGPRFTPKETKLDPTTKCLEYLSKLCQQAGLVISSTPEGDLRVWRSKPPLLPVARLEEGDRPLVGLAQAHRPQEYYSEINVFGTPDTGRRRKRSGAPSTGGLVHLPNPRWGGKGQRCRTMKLDDTDEGDGAGAAAAKLGRMMGNACSWTLTVPTWRDQFGALWDVNTSVSLRSPSAMIYEWSTFVVRTVTLSRTAEEEQADLELVLPGAFNGEVPSRFPWD